MLLNKLRDNYKAVHKIISDSIDWMDENMSVEFHSPDNTKIKMWVHHFIENPKYFDTVGRQVEKRAKKYNACVVPKFDLHENAWVYDELTVYRDKLSKFLNEIDEAESYKEILNNPIIGDEFDDKQQVQMIDVLKSVINAAENGEEYVISNTDIEGGLLTALLEAFDIKMERISLGKYKFYGWADAN